MTKEELEREYYSRRPTEPYSEDDNPNDWANIVQYAEENLGKAFKTIAELETENAELKEKLDKIRNYLANDIPHELMNEATNKIWRMV